MGGETLTYRWRRLHAIDAFDLWRRFTTSAHKNIVDGLIEKGRVRGDERRDFVWIVRTSRELVRLIGALQYVNPDLALWFRGEPGDYPDCRPARCRSPKDPLPAVQKWFDDVAAFERLLRDRGKIARLAIFQHYGIPTSFIDVTHNHRIACQFAYKNGGASSYLRVFASPRVQRAVNVHDGSGLCIVDLRAELPSYCLRPHVQEAAFIGRVDSVLSDLDSAERLDPEQARIDEACIARIKLELERDDWEKHFAYDEKHLLPEESTSCVVCPGEPKRADLTGDLLKHVLKCVQREKALGADIDFPR